jgi:C4-dicarboxylate-specific signal transduction histidine kinase
MKENEHMEEVETPRNKESIVSRTIIIAVIAVLFFGGAFIALKYWSQSIAISTKDDLLKAVVQQAKEPARIFANSHSILKGLVTDKTIINFLATAGGTPNKETPTREAVEETLSRFNIENYPAIYLIDTSGLTIASTDKEGAFLGKNYGLRDYFIKAMNGEPWTDMAVGLTTGKPGYFFSEPVKDENGKIIGVAAIKLDNAVIDQAVLTGLLSSFGGNIMITDTDGVIICSEQRDQLYKTLTMFNEKKKQAVIAKKKFIVSDFKSINLNKVQQAIDDYSYPLIIEFIDPGDSRSKIVALTAIGKSPFYLIVEVDKTKLTSSFLENFIIISLYVLLIILVIALAIYLLFQHSRSKETYVKIDLE